MKKIPFGERVKSSLGGIFCLEVRERVWSCTRKYSQLFHLLSFSDVISEKTIHYALELFSKCGKEEYFGRTIVADITGLKSTRASELIKLLVDSKVIVPVTGHGKGKYRFQ